MSQKGKEARTDAERTRTDGEEQVELTAEMAKADPAYQAEVVRQLLVPGVLHNLVNLDLVSTPGLKVYVDQLVEEARTSDDPIERMMVEHLAMAHVRIARLHDQATRSGDPAETEACDKAAARLLGEFRRLALALQQYRGQTQGKSTTVIHRVEQANIAADQEVAYAKADAPEGRVSRMHCRDAKLEPQEDVGGRFSEENEESGPGRGQPAQRAEAGAMDT